jgi:hypothetical protein
LQSITLPNNLETIGDNAFKECDALTSITIPASVKTIGENIFYGSDKLKEVYYNSDASPASPIAQATNISLVVFGGTVVPHKVLQYCSSVSEVRLADSITTIESYAFDGCGNLSKITVGSNLKIVEHSAFLNCSSLTTVELPSELNWQSIQMAYDNEMFHWIMKNTYS